MNHPVAEEDGRRWVALEGAFNFRDVGGYAAGGRERVRWGAVYRSDALHHLSPSDLDTLESLGVDRVIDLRSPTEIASVGRGSLGEGQVEYLTASVIPTAGSEATGAPSSDDLAERYMWYLEVGRDAIAESFEILAASHGGAVVFHCAAGKDRTGVLAALLLEVLGVGDDDIIADYALTGRALPSILARLAQDPVHGVAVSQIPDSRRMVRPDVMRAFLQLLDARYGGARAWLEEAGVRPRSIDALRSGLLLLS
jgi:protein-tyrosine phosphatase